MMAPRQARTAGLGIMGTLRLLVFAPLTSPPGVSRRARMVCHCAKVDETAIRAALDRGDSVEMMRDALGCGGGCGACLPEIRRMAAGR